MGQRKKQRSQLELEGRAGSVSSDELGFPLGLSNEESDFEFKLQTSHLGKVGGILFLPCNPCAGCGVLRLVALCRSSIVVSTSQQ